MTLTEVITKQNDIIRQMADIIDELYMLLSQHLADDEDLPVFVGIQTIARKVGKGKDGSDSMDY